MFYLIRLSFWALRISLMMMLQSLKGGNLAGTKFGNKVCRVKTSNKRTSINTDVRLFFRV